MSQPTQQQLAFAFDRLAQVKAAQTDDGGFWAGTPFGLVRVFERRIEGEEDAIDWFIATLEQARLDSEKENQN